MSPQIFMTGASGYIGGQLLHDFTIKHPQYQVTALVRTEEQQKRIVTIYPSVKCVIGGLDSSNIIIEESRKADVVMQAADCDHVNVLASIIEGINQGDKKGTLIQLSGAASILDTSNGHGNPTTKIWDDIVDLSEISTFPLSRFHSTTDQLLLNTYKNHGIRTAIIVPPIVYGKADGPKPFSFGLTTLVEAIKKRGKAFTVGKGETLSNYIHVKDVAAILLHVAEQALNLDGGLIEWGEKGFYFVEGEELKIGDIVRNLAEKMQKRGTIDSAETEQLTLDEVNKIHPWASIMWGSNMRIHGSRLRKAGWKPTQPGVLALNYQLLE